MNPRILAYVAYFFPPLGGAGVQRTLKFARYLPQHGWAPTVITVRESRYWMRDPSLVGEIPPGVEVMRTRALTGHSILGMLGGGKPSGGPIARRSGTMIRRLRAASRWIAVPDPFVGWVPYATAAARRVLRRGGVLMTTSSPDSAHLVGLDLAGKRGIAWVADFRDPWVRRMSFDPPSEIHRRIHESLERRVVRRATRIVVTSDRTRDDFLGRYPDCDPARFVVIPNGYDEEDFPEGEVPPDPSFRLLHIGQLNPERPIGPLLDALERFLGSRDGARDDTRVDMIGPRYLEHEREAARRGLGDVVRFRDPLPHRDAVAIMGRARVLLVLEQESERGALILPGKTFELLRARRPILGLVPHGAAWDLIEGLGAGACALPSDPSRAAEALGRWYDAYRRGEDPAPVAGMDAIRGFERRALAARLAAVLNAAASAAGL